VTTATPSAPPSNVYDDIAKAAKVRASADNWIFIICLLEGLAAFIAIPFTLGLSLLVLLAIVPTAALGSIATSSKRNAELQRLQAELLAEQTSILSKGLR